MCVCEHWGPCCLCNPFSYFGDSQRETASSYYWHQQRSVCFQFELLSRPCWWTDNILAHRHCPCPCCPCLDNRCERVILQYQVMGCTDSKSATVGLSSSSRVSTSTVSPLPPQQQQSANGQSTNLHNSKRSIDYGSSSLLLFITSLLSRWSLFLRGGLRVGFTLKRQKRRITSLIQILFFFFFNIFKVNIVSACEECSLSWGSSTNQTSMHFLMVSWVELMMKKHCLPVSMFYA